MFRGGREASLIGHARSIFAHGYEALWIIGISFFVEISVETCETKKIKLSREI